MGPTEIPILATADGAPWASGFPWWQAVGGTLAVLALLVMFLRLLGRWHGPVRNGDAALLAVIPLGPRREVQILRLKDEVHYIYRHDSALLPLNRESYAAWRAANPEGSSREGRPFGVAIGRLFGLLRQASRPRSDRLAAVAGDRPSPG